MQYSSVNTTKTEAWIDTITSYSNSSTAGLPSSWRDACGHLDQDRNEPAISLRKHQTFSTDTAYQMKDRFSRIKKAFDNRAVNPTTSRSTDAAPCHALVVKTDTMHLGHCTISRDCTIFRAKEKSPKDRGSECETLTTKACQTTQTGLTPSTNLCPWYRLVARSPSKDRTPETIRQC